MGIYCGKYVQKITWLSNCFVTLLLQNVRLFVSIMNKISYICNTSVSCKYDEVSVTSGSFIINGVSSFLYSNSFYVTH